MEFPRSSIDFDTVPNAFLPIEQILLHGRDQKRAGNRSSIDKNLHTVSA